MTTTRQILGTEDEPPSTSLSTLAVDSTALGITELRERVVVVEPDNAVQELSAPCLGSKVLESSKVIEAGPDFSSLSTAHSSQLRPEKIPELKNTSHAAREMELHARLQRLKERPAFIEKVRQSSARSKTSSTKSYSLFKNPYYKYRGGIIARILSFIANLIKLLEIFLLRKLSSFKSSPNSVAIKIEPLTEAALKAMQKQEEDRLKERKKMSLTGARQGDR